MKFVFICVWDPFFWGGGRGTDTQFWPVLPESRIHARVPASPALKTRSAAGRGGGGWTRTFSLAIFGGHSTPPPAPLRLIRLLCLYYQTMALSEIDALTVLKFIFEYYISSPHFVFMVRLAEMISILVYSIYLLYKSLRALFHSVFL